MYFLFSSIPRQKFNTLNRSRKLNIRDESQESHVKLTPCCAAILATIAFDTIAVIKSPLQTALADEYISDKKLPSRLSPTNCVNDDITGTPTLAARAVLLGKIAESAISVAVKLYANPITFLPKTLIKKYAILIPIVVLLIALAHPKTKNNSQGIFVANPEKPCVCKLTIPVMLAINNEIKRM